MSGHSKWANIRVKKTAQDSKRGKVFTRHAKLIEIAAREGGGGDPVMNTRLSTAIENAKMDNVPNMNIERAIKKGSGELKGEQTEEVVYEAYGPGGAAFIIECLTDNKNRTLNSVRSAIEKRGGKWAEGGSVRYLFDRKGVVVARKEGTKEDEEQELELIDFGAEDFEWAEGTLSVTTTQTEWPRIRDLLKSWGYEIVSAGLQYVPKQWVEVSDSATAKHVMEFMEIIEEDEDVSEVHTNADITLQP